MSDALLDGEFPLGHCARCDKEVLVGVTLDERGEERRTTCTARPSSAQRG